MIQKILKRSIDTFNLSRILRYYVFIRTGSIILMFICNVSLAFVTELSDLVCAIKLLFITIITGTGEYLIFCYLMTTSIILKQLNYSLKELKALSFNDTKNILQFYFDLKKDIQNISQIFVFFKVIYSTVQLATIFYQLLTQEEDDDWTLSPQIYNFATVFCWFLTVTLEMLLMLYPFVHYYEQVKRKINYLIYIYIQSDHKKTPQLISFLFEIRFQPTVHQIKGFKKYYKLDINYMIICMKYVKKIIHTYQILLGNVSK
jgi:hypothetical protein